MVSREPLSHVWNYRQGQIQDSGSGGQRPTKPKDFTYKLVDKMLKQADNIA